MIRATSPFHYLYAVSAASTASATSHHPKDASLTYFWAFLMNFLMVWGSRLHHNLLSDVYGKPMKGRLDSMITIIFTKKEARKWKFSNKKIGGAKERLQKKNMRQTIFDTLNPNSCWVKAESLLSGENVTKYSSRLSISSFSSFSSFFSFSSPPPLPNSTATVIDCLVRIVKIKYNYKGQP